jgi:hypothetical protein
VRNSFKVGPNYDRPLAPLTAASIDAQRPVVAPVSKSLAAVYWPELRNGYLDHRMVKKTNWNWNAFCGAIATREICR